MEEDPRAQARLQVMLEHLGGHLTASQAAERLGVSRKTFYEWLERAREAMRQALADRPVGRPRHPADPERERLEGELRAARKQNQLLETRLQIREAFDRTLQEWTDGAERKKKEREP